MALEIVSQKLLDLRVKVLALKPNEELNCPFEQLILDYVSDLFKQSQKKGNIIYFVCQLNDIHKKQNRLKRQLSLSSNRPSVPHANCSGRMKVCDDQITFRGHSCSRQFGIFPKIITNVIDQQLMQLSSQCRILDGISLRKSVKEFILFHFQNTPLLANKNWQSILNIDLTKSKIIYSMVILEMQKIFF